MLFLKCLFDCVIVTPVGDKTLSGFSVKMLIARKESFISFLILYLMRNIYIIGLVYKTIAVITDCNGFLMRYKLIVLGGEVVFIVFD